MKIYLVGSLRNPNVPVVANALEQVGHTVFSDWFAAGPIADDSWQTYERERGRTYLQALKGVAADHVFQFDLKWLRWAEVGVLITPAGKSAHLELGWMIGAGKKGYVLLHEEPERWDVMYCFADAVVYSVPELLECLQ